MTDNPVRDSLVKNADLVRGNTVSLSDLLTCADERDALRAENGQLRAGINLHQHDGYAGCTECGKAWPCPTVEPSGVRWHA